MDKSMYAHGISEKEKSSRDHVLGVHTPFIKLAYQHSHC